MQPESEDRGWDRFLFTSGARTLTSKRFSIHLDDDDPPVVTIDVPRPTVPSNRSLQFSWTAADDFGLERVLLEVETKSGTQSFLLRKPQDNRLELQAKLRRAMSELGLRAGDKAKIRVVAYDNQAPISADGVLESAAEANQPFGKRGESVWVEIEVLSPQMAAERLRQLNRQLRDAMVPILADFLVDRLPVSGRRAQTKQMVSWSIKARKRFDPLRSSSKKPGKSAAKLLTVDWCKQ